MQSFLVYGSTSTGKTTLCGQFARYQHWLHRGAPCLYVGCDSGAESAADEIADGCMIPYNLGSHPNPLWALRRLARGYWPSQIDGLGRAVNPWEFIDLRRLGLRISGLIVEGITRINELLSGSITNEMQLDTQEPLTAKFRLRPGGTDGLVIQGLALQAAELDNEESFSMASRGTYKFLQEQTLDYVNRLKAHPYAHRLLMTAHQGEGKTSEGITARVLGPAVFGRAVVDKAPGWFSSYFHVETIPEGEFGVLRDPQGRELIHPITRRPILTPESRALWFRFHPDRLGSGLMWPGKLGASPRLTHMFREYFSAGYSNAWIDQNGKLQGGLYPFLMAFDAEPRPRPQVQNNQERLLV